MSKKTKIWLITAAFLVLIGSIIFAGVMSMLQWDFMKLSTVKRERNTYEIGEAFSSISMNTYTADIVFAVSDNEKCKVECYEKETSKHSVTVEEGTLVVEVFPSKSWYDYIGIDFGTSKITVYLPKAEYDLLFIKENTGDIEITQDFKFKGIDILVTTGDIQIENISAGAMDLSVSTGKITVSDVICEGDIKTKVSTGKTNMTDAKCQNLLSSGSTGDISLKNVLAAEKFSIERTTGDVKLDGCDAAELFITTDTGDVTGTLLSDKVYITETSTGRIRVPQSTSGGKCEITTSTGNITINKIP